MAGCFGNSFWDRAMEQQLFNHLAHENDVYCEKCGEEKDSSEWEYDEEENTVTCPKCESVIKL